MFSFDPESGSFFAGAESGAELKADTDLSAFYVFADVSSSGPPGVLMAKANTSGDGWWHGVHYSTALGRTFVTTQFNTRNQFRQFEVDVRTGVHACAVAWDRDADTTLWLDGEAPQTQDISPYASEGTSATRPVRLASNGTAGFCFAGKIIQAALWQGHALTQADYDVLYNGGKFIVGAPLLVSPSKLILCWDLRRWAAGAGNPAITDRVREVVANKQNSPAALGEIATMIEGANSFRDGVLEYL